MDPLADLGEYTICCPLVEAHNHLTGCIHMRLSIFAQHLSTDNLSFVAGLRGRPIPAPASEPALAKARRPIADVLSEKDEATNSSVRVPGTLLTRGDNGRGVCPGYIVGLPTLNEILLILVGFFLPSCTEYVEPTVYWVCSVR